MEKWSKSKNREVLEWKQYPGYYYTKRHVNCVFQERLPRKYGIYLFFGDGFGKCDVWENFEASNSFKALKKFATQ